MVRFKLGDRVQVIIHPDRKLITAAFRETVGKQGTIVEVNKDHFLITLDGETKRRHYADISLISVETVRLSEEQKEAVFNWLAATEV